MAQSDGRGQRNTRVRGAGLTGSLTAQPTNPHPPTRGSGIREVVYKDREGRKWKRGIPFNAPDTDAEFGVPLGPPSLADLGLPLEVEVRLHNQLFDRGILTEREARKRIGDVVSSLQAALRVDALRILTIYQG